MRSLEKRQYEIEQGLRDPSELLGGKDKEEDGDEGDEEESEAAKAARAENLTKAAITAATKLLKSTDEVERMKVSYTVTCWLDVVSTRWFPPLPAPGLRLLFSCSPVVFTFMSTCVMIVRHGHASSDARKQTETKRR